MNRKIIINTLGILQLMCFFSLGNVANAQDKSNTEKAGDVVQLVIPATAYATTFILDDNKGRNQFYKSFLLNLVITYGLKIVINKPRPENHGDYSFPSGHTSASFQGATFFHKRYGWKYGIPSYLGAVFVSWSRVESYKHDAIDVMGGAVIGILSSYYFTTSHKDVTVTQVACNGYYRLTISKKW